MLLAYLSIQASWQPTRLHKWPQINLRGLQSAYLYFKSGHKPTWHWNPSSLCTEPTNYDSDYKQSTWNISTQTHPWRKIKGTLHIFPLSWWTAYSTRLWVAEFCYRDTCLVSNIREVHDASLVVLTEPTALIPEIMTQFLKIIHRPCWVQFHRWTLYVLLLFTFTLQLHCSTTQKQTAGPSFTQSVVTSNINCTEQQVGILDKHLLLCAVIVHTKYSHHMRHGAVCHFISSISKNYAWLISDSESSLKRFDQCVCSYLPMLDWVISQCAWRAWRG